MLTKLNLDDRENTLLDLIKSKQIPSYRQAYSDRTAWLMASLSELVYQPFGGLNPESSKKFLQKKLEDLLDKETKEALDELVTAIIKRDEETTKPLIIQLDFFDIKIEETYDREGTQAFLVSNEDYLVLVFRGTEANCFKDIKSDVNAIKTRCSTEGGIHSGFNNAFELVEESIQRDLNKQEYAHKPLIIAGHSLGGAIATLAAKRLRHNGGISACYTFGSPRVGDEEWSYGLKTPIYRVVNAVDCVTMLPPSGGVVSSIRFILGLIPFLGKILRKFIANFDGYFHVGDMRYLTNCKPNKYDLVQITHTASFFRRMQIIIRGNSATKFVKDHSISIYRKKLAIIALRRNKSS
jgi:triacylglycerol lipase